MSTLQAIAKAARSVYVLVLFLGAVALLIPGFGLRSVLIDFFGDTATLYEVAIGWLFLGLLIEHIRSAMLQRRQAYLARALIRTRPELRKEEAIKILIRALESGEPRVVSNAHRELKRLTNCDFGTDPAPWQRWLKEQQQKTGEEEPSIETEMRDRVGNS